MKNDPDKLKGLQMKCKGEKGKEESDEDAWFIKVF